MTIIAIIILTAIIKVILLIITSYIKMKIKDNDNDDKDNAPNKDNKT